MFAFGKGCVACIMESSGTRYGVINTAVGYIGLSGKSNFNFSNTVIFLCRKLSLFRKIKGKFETNHPILIAVEVV